MPNGNWSLFRINQLSVLFYLDQGTKRAEILTFLSSLPSFSCCLTTTFCLFRFHCFITHVFIEYPISASRIVYEHISKLMIPTPQSPQHSAKYSGKSPYFGRFESELTCSVRSLLTYFEKIQLT